MADSNDMASSFLLISSSMRYTAMAVPICVHSRNGTDIGIRLDVMYAHNMDIAVKTVACTKILLLKKL